MEQSRSHEPLVRQEALSHSAKKELAPMDIEMGMDSDDVGRSFQRVEHRLESGKDEVIIDGEVENEEDFMTLGVSPHRRNQE